MGLFAESPDVNGGVMLQNLIRSLACFIWLLNTILFETRSRLKCFKSNLVLIPFSLNSITVQGLQDHFVHQFCLTGRLFSIESHGLVLKENKKSFSENRNATEGPKVTIEIRESAYLISYLSLSEKAVSSASLPGHVSNSLLACSSTLLSSLSFHG